MQGLRWMVLGAALSAAAGVAIAARVASVAPQGEVAQVRQVQVRFDQAVVNAGDPRAAAPFLLSCNGSTPPGDARWAGPNEWLYDLRQTLAAGSRCTLKLNPAFQALDGPLQGPAEYRFSSGAPVVVSVQPYAGATIEEDQHFILRLNGAADPASVLASAWCEVEGLGERIPLRIVQGPVREQVLNSQRVPRRNADAGETLLLACQRPFPADAGVRLVWGAGIAAAGQPTLVSKRAQRFAWKVRRRFLAEFTCERENAQSPCMPLRPLTLRFSAPVAREQALAARLLPAQGQPISPKVDAQRADAWLSEVQFAAPLPENTRFSLSLPVDLKDDSGRSLANAGAFPLQVATGGMPPLAKFAGSGFGILEAGSRADEPALLPLTLRHVQADITGAATSGQVAIKRLEPSTPDEALLRWLARLRQDQQTQFKSRATGMLEQEADAHRAELPPPQGSEPRATDVIGIPLPNKGYHVVEVRSRILGQALLANRAPMYVRTGALVTNLGVHFKRGRSSSLVWVTSLDRGRPVVGARVAVNDCMGKPLWNGSTDANGIARIERGFDEGHGEKCLSDEGLFVTARTADDLSFVFSDWNRGIEPWRFGLPQASGTTPDQRAHTVMDRSLLRAGETLSMKHFVRLETEQGLALPATNSLPTELLITHVGSDTQFRLPLQWPAGARSAESRWPIPKNAALGLYDLALVRGDARWPSGSLRVEAFRVPLVDARLSPPAHVPVAPAELAFAAQLNALAGGPMAQLPLKLSALLRPVSPAFAGQEDFSFSAPREAAAEDEEDSDQPGKLVADKQAARTDAQGAAQLLIKGLPPLKGPADLQAELSFSDPSGEVQTVAQTLRLWPAAVVAGLRVANWAASRGQARFTALVLDTRGKPLAGRAVEVQGRLQQTLSTRKRIVGGFYAYDNQRQTRDLGTLCSGNTDAQGRLHCDVQLTVAGEVQLIAQARDDAGRSSRAAGSVWVSGESDWWFAQDNDDRIDLLPEQREVEPGQTARLQVRMPFRQATALVTVEREGVMSSQVLQLSGREPVIELPIPKDPAHSWAPNVTVTALVLRGRLREAPWWSLFTWGWKAPVDWWRAFRHESPDWRAPTAMADLAKPSFKLGVAQLKVGLAEHRLDVKVTPEKPQYGVRETVKTVVRVSHAGQPAAGAQIAFAAVDEGLLALQANRSWELLDMLMQPRPWGVETATAQGEIIGRRHYGRKALPPGGGGGRNPTRELFDTLLLWRGTVTLDAQGEARIEVPLNDSLTSFRLVAIADAAGPNGVQRFGTGSASVRVTQDLQMLSGLAPLAREGDRFEAGFTLRNTTPHAMNVKATLVGKATTGTGTGTGTGNTPLTLPPQTVQLAAGAALELRWPVEVPAGATRIEWQGAAEETGGPAHDRLQIVQAVLPSVPLRVWQATLAPLQGNFSVPVAAPADALPGRSQLVATLQPRLSGALPGLQRYFQTYPYSCLEQKTSRSIALHDARAWATLRDELPAYLDADGLANYFPVAAGSAARGSDRLTAYLLTSAQQAGLAWPDAQREAMLAGLTAFVEGRLQRRFAAPRADLDVRKLAALDALARHGRALPRMLDSIAYTPAAWPTSALLDAWSLLQRVPGMAERDARLDEVQRLLRSRLVAGGTTLRFSTEAEDDWWWLMDGPDANAARLVLAAVDAPAWQADLPLLVNGALARQKGGAWQTTTANLWGVLALERFSALFEKTPVTGSSTLQVGAASARHDWSAAPEGGRYNLPLPAQPGIFSAQHQGTGRPWLSLQTLAAVPLTAPLAAGYRINKTWSAVERKSPDSWSRGDTVRVRLEIEAVGDMAWVVVQDPLPSGATVLGSGLGRDSAIATQGEKRQGAGLLAYEERAAEAWRAYFEWLPRGKQVLEYTLRLNTAGRLLMPPTRVEALYAPESFGERPNAAVEVRP